MPRKPEANSLQYHGYLSGYSVLPGRRFVSRVENLTEGFKLRFIFGVVRRSILKYVVSFLPRACTPPQQLTLSSRCES